MVAQTNGVAIKVNWIIYTEPRDSMRRWDVARLRPLHAVSLTATVPPAPAAAAMATVRGAGPQPIRCAITSNAGQSESQFFFYFLSFLLELFFRAKSFICPGNVI